MYNEILGRGGYFHRRGRGALLCQGGRGAGAGGVGNLWQENHKIQSIPPHESGDTAAGSDSHNELCSNPLKHPVAEIDEGKIA